MTGFEIGQQVLGVARLFTTCEGRKPQERAQENIRNRRGWRSVEYIYSVEGPGAEPLPPEYAGALQYSKAFGGLRDEVCKGMVEGYITVLFHPPSSSGMEQGESFPLGKCLGL